jgi:hypothetical protein
VESSILVMPYLSHLMPYKTSSLRTAPQHFSFPFTAFNQPISNDTEQELDSSFSSSWQVDLSSSLRLSPQKALTEAEIAFAPTSPSENNAIPAIIVQERADGLVRVEYFAQNWPNTYGLLLYNSTSPSWMQAGNLTMIFKSLGPPSKVNPELAPRPNGSLQIQLGGSTVLSDYPIAWANLSDLYVYGYPGSSFIGGSVEVSIYGLPPT